MSILYKSLVLGSGGGPVLYYRLDEATNATSVVDFSAHAYNGSYSGTGVTWQLAGAIVGDGDKATQFDGTAGEIQAPPILNSAINGLLTISIEFWVNLINLSFLN